MFECSRVKPRQRAAVRVAPLRETPGARAAACARPSARPSTAGRWPASRGSAGAGRRSPSPPRRRAGRPRSAAARRGWRSIWRSRAKPIAARAGRRGRAPAPCGGRRCWSSSAITRRCPISSAERRSDVQRDLEALAQLGTRAVPVPAGEPGDQGQVGGAGDRQQLGRPLNGAEDDARLARPGRRHHRGLCRGLGPRPPGRPRCHHRARMTTRATIGRRHRVVEVVELVLPVLPVAADLACR